MSMYLCTYRLLYMCTWVVPRYVSMRASCPGGTFSSPHTRRAFPSRTCCSLYVPRQASAQAPKHPSSQAPKYKYQP